MAGDIATGLGEGVREESRNSEGHKRKSSEEMWCERQPGGYGRKESEE